MNALPTAGRYLFAIPMAVFGTFHFMNAGAMAGMVPVPGGVFWIYLTGAALIAAAVSIVIGSHAVLATRLLGLLLLTFAVSIHLMGVINAADQAAMQSSLSSFLKDTALAGGAWVLSGVFQRSEAAAEVTTG